MQGSDLRLFIEQAPMAAAMFDAEMRYIAVSSRWRAERNLDNSVLGRTAYEVFPDVEAKFRSLHRRALAGETIACAEDSLAIPHGAVQWVRWEMRPWRGANGEIGGIVIFAEDITARKAAEEALRKSEERYRYALDATSDGVWDWDLKTGKVDYSPAYYRMLGYDAADWADSDVRFWIDALHPEDRDRAVSLAHESLASTGHYELEFRLRAKDGSYRWVLSRGKVVERDGSGNPVRAVGTHVDITERRLAAQALLEKSTRLAFAQSAARVGVWDWQIAADTASISDECYDIFGLPRGAPHSYALFLEIVHPEDRQRVDAIMREALCGDGQFDCEYRITRPSDGATRWVKSRGQISFDEAGHPIRGLGALYDVTEFRLVEAALLESEQRSRAQRDELESIYRNAPIGLCFFDRDLRYQRINRQLADMNGLPIEAHIGRTVAEVVPTLAAQIEKITREILATRKPVRDLELVGETPSAPGVKRYWNEAWYPTFSPDGEITGFGVVVEEVTERKRAESALKESAERLNLAQSAAQIGIWDLDIVADAAWVNDQYRLLLGFPADIAIAYPDFLARLHPDDRAGYEEMVQRAISGEGAIDRECRIVRPDGAIRWLRSKGVVFFDKDGRPLRAMGAVWDITAFKDAQEALLQRSEDRYRRIVETAQEGIWLIGADAKTSFVNPKMAALLGYESEEMLGRDLMEVMDDEWREVAERKLVDRAAGVVETHEFKFRRKDGSALWALLSCAPIIEAGVYRGALAMVTDFTERKRLEGERQRYLEELKQVDRKKDEFLATLGHELRTPLATIKLAIDVIEGDAKREGVLCDKNLPLFARMQRQVNHLMRLVEDILHVSRMSRGQIELKREPFDLNVLLAQIIDAQQPRLEAQGLQLNVVLSNAALPVHGDSVRLTQVFGNLLDNAGKYTESGGTVDLTVAREADAAVVSVRDSGIGIPPAELSSIFELFNQMKHGPERGREGIGVGLALARKLVELHGGSIEARSEGLGKGSEFVVRLPLAVHSAPAQKTDRAPASSV